MCLNTSSKLIVVRRLQRADEGERGPHLVRPVINAAGATKARFLNRIFGAKNQTRFKGLNFEFGAKGDSTESVFGTLQ